MQTLGFLLELAPDPRTGFKQCESRRSAPCHVDGKLLLDYWNERDRVLLMGQDLPCRRLAKVLPNLAVLDYRASARDFRIRLAGFALVRRFGHDIGHRYLRDIVTEDEHEHLRALFLEVRDTGQPAIRDVKIRSPDRPLVHYEMMALRVLAVDRETPLILMGMFFFDRKKRRAAAA